MHKELYISMQLLIHVVGAAACTFIVVNRDPLFRSSNLIKYSKRICDVGVKRDLAGMKNSRSKKWKRIIPICILVVLILGFLLYTGQYYHAEPSALPALESDPSVSVTKTDYGWLFDGPSKRDALIFYPGAKVEETAYAPLLHQLAEEGMDVCLVKMPFHLALFGMNKADDLIAEYDYSRWFIGGHSLGGTMAANYASEHEAQLTGLVLLAAYPTKKLGDHLVVTSIYGSEDGVLNMEKLKEGEQYLPEDTVSQVILGGNHAQFGNYGEQNGDGNAAISAAQQQRQTVELILEQCSS